MQAPATSPRRPLPGQLGNAAIAGHRTTYGAPFGTIDKMAVGDVITVTVPGAGTYHYVTNRIEIVLPEDYGRVMPRPEQGDPDPRVVPPEVHDPEAVDRACHARRESIQHRHAADPDGTTRPRRAS
jgi:hypothetical protein